MKKILVLLVLFPTVYINYLVYESLVIQRDLLIEFNQQKYKESTTASFNVMNMNIPSIGVTTIPIKHLVSKYFFLAEDYEKALKLIEEGNKENPYLKSGSMFKSEIYEHLGVTDSAFYYSKDAFSKMPGTPRHYAYYTKHLVKKDSIEGLLKSYQIVKDFNNTEFHVNFLVSLKETLKEKKVDSLNELVSQIRNRFPTDKKVQVAADHYFYGVENINESIKYSESASAFYSKGMFNEAIFNFKKASELNPGDYVNFENLAYVYIQKKDYRKALPILYDIIENKRRVETGKSEFLLGLTLSNLDSIDKACEYFQLAKKMNFPDSYAYVSKLCR